MYRIILWFGIVIMTFFMCGCSKESLPIAKGLDCSKKSNVSMYTSRVNGEWKCCGNGIQCSNDETTIVECHNNEVTVTKCPKGKICSVDSFKQKGSCITDENDEEHRCDDVAQGDFQFSRIGDKEWKCCGNGTSCVEKQLVKCTNNVVSVLDCPDNQECKIIEGKGECVVSEQQETKE